MLVTKMIIKLITLIWLFDINVNVSGQFLINQNESLSNDELLSTWIRKRLDEPKRAMVESYDGWQNNLISPQIGVKDSNIVRFAESNYADGVCKANIHDLPNPLELSERFASTSIETVSSRGLNALAVFFGQHAFNEVLRQADVACPVEYVNIDIPEHHYFHRTTGHRQMLFERRRHDPSSGRSEHNVRKQINQATPWIDGETIYGNSKVRRNYLTDFKTGKLRTSGNGLYPPKNDMKLSMDNLPPASDSKPTVKPLNRLLVTGDARSNETPFLLAINTIWIRWHNHLVDQWSARYPKWSPVRKFEEARKWVIATQQHVIIDEWLPSLFDRSLPAYVDYDRMLNPQASEVFSSLGSKYLLALIPAVLRVQPLFDCRSRPTVRTELRLCRTFFAADRTFRSRSAKFFDELTVAMANHAAKREDGRVIDDLRLFHYGHLDFTRRDALADAIQAAREQGIPSYLMVRSALNLTIFETFEQMAGNVWPALDTESVHEVERMYSNDVWRVDALLGCLFELRSGSSPTLERIIMEQFARIRDADRFWFENTQNGLFTNEEIAKIQRMSFKQVVSETTGIEAQHLQPNVFLLPDDAANLLPQAHECMLEDQELSYRCQLQPGSNKSRTCFAIRPLEVSTVAPCSPPMTFDYFHGSETWYIATFATITVIVMSFIPISWWRVHVRQRQNRQLSKKVAHVKVSELNKESCLVLEWLGPDEEDRPIEVQFDSSRKRICLLGFADRKCLRQINLTNARGVLFQCNGFGKQHYFVMKMLHEYDLALRFDSLEERNQFCCRTERFLSSIGVGSERVDSELSKMLRNVYTKKKRQEHVEAFFHAVFAHAFGLKSDRQLINIRRAKNILNTELTQFEFAEALSMRPDSQFVQQMFALVDKDRNGYLSFREFLDMMIVFAKGTAEQKAKLMFDMYDISGKGTLSKQDFTLMIRSMLELANQDFSNQELEQLVFSMCSSAGLHDRNHFTLTDFLNILGDFKDEFNYLELNLEVEGFDPSMTSMSRSNRKSAVFRAQETFVRTYSILDLNRKVNSVSTFDTSFIKLKSNSSEEPESSENSFVRFLDERRWQIFWTILFHLILFGLCLDKAYYYTFERADQGLRRIGGYGVTVTRAAASSMMFCFALLLLSMCRNLITCLRETFLHHYIPFDSVISFHKYVGCWAFVLCLLHSIGHAVNFYSISTQSVSTLRCLFREVYIESDSLPKFHDWCFKTITGVTGISLLLLICLLCVFATPYARRHTFQAFWATHSLYPFVYLLTFMHGLGKLIQPPIFIYFMAIPLPLFALDRLISLSRKKIELCALAARLHPSDVTFLQLKRPTNFVYRSGQWARIACLNLNPDEYHPFTLASAPHEEHIHFYIRAVGPFTKNLRQLIANRTKNDPLPSFYLDGPYGEGHQDWSKYEVSILVGGGIGVTPFASILKDIAFRSNQLSQITCRRIFFLWITRTQKHFEWLVDIIRQVEQADKHKLVSTHIFITQFQKKFDLRTMMLYVCERHFQRVSGRSLFTGLQAKTHFGRPDFEFFFSSLQSAYADVNRMGVFSCGPNPMTSNVQRACEQLNRRPGPLFIHHYENF